MKDEFEILRIFLVMKILYLVHLVEYCGLGVFDKKIEMIVKRFFISVVFYGFTETTITLETDYG